MNMRGPEVNEQGDLDRLIEDLVRANTKVRRCQARWAPDDEARQEEQAALGALLVALSPPAPEPEPSSDIAVEPQAPEPADPPPLREALELRCDGEDLVEVVGAGQFQLEQMSNNHWWMVFEAQGQRVDVWLHARGKITATFEREAAKDG